jgi:hypothetical protein
MKFIDTSNKPIKQIAQKTTNKLNVFKKSIVKKVEKKLTPLKPINITTKKVNPPTPKKSIVKKVSTIK